MANAGGLNPAGLADRLRELAAELGLDAAVAHVEGDDLLPRAAELGLGEPLTANAYLGGFGHRRVPDAPAPTSWSPAGSPTPRWSSGPAVAHFGWARDDYDGSPAPSSAGHVIECGAQATGGNYAFFTELAGPAPPRLPDRRGRTPTAPASSPSTPGTGGAVSVGTVTAQLLYEISRAPLRGPDVTARLDSVDADAGRPGPGPHQRRRRRGAAAAAEGRR